MRTLVGDLSFTFRGGESCTLPVSNEPCGQAIHSELNDRL